MQDAHGDVYLPGPQRTTDMKADMMGTLSSAQRGGKKKEVIKGHQYLRYQKGRRTRKACVVGSQKEEVQGVWSDEAEQ